MRLQAVYGQAFSLASIGATADGRMSGASTEGVVKLLQDSASLSQDCVNFFFKLRRAHPRDAVSRNDPRDAVSRNEASPQEAEGLRPEASHKRWKAKTP